MKKMSEHARCAKAIRIHLKELFPKTKFSVTSHSYSGGDSVRIYWTDGVTQERVSNVVRKYQAGSFDGMTDSYTYNDNEFNLPQAKYVKMQRNYSEKAFNDCWEEVKKCYIGFEDIIDLDKANKELFEKYETWTARNFIYRILVKQDIEE